MAAPGTTRPNFSATRPAAPSGSPQVDGLGSALLEQGGTQSKALARNWAQAIVAQLKKDGLFGVTLKSTLTQVQADAGLAQTGRLDGPTVRFLEGKAPMPASSNLASEVAAGQGGKKGSAAAAVDRGAASVKAELRPAPSKTRDAQRLSGRRPVGQVPGEQAPRSPARAGLSEAQPVNARGGVTDILKSLMMLGFMGGSRGEALPDAIKAFQKSVGLPPSGKNTVATQEALKAALHSEKATSTPDAPEGGGRSARTGAEAKSDADAVHSSKAAKQAATSTSAAQGQTKTDASAQERARSAQNSGQDATMRGTPEPGDPAALAGRAANGLGQAQASGQGGAGSGQVKGATGAVEESDLDGTEGLETNAHAGDEDALDEDRGWANLKGDGDADGPGHWEMEPLANQITAALEVIERDDDGHGPATYRWDATFYRPGVYAAQQPATPLWHIGIEKVSAFDAVWENARAVLTRRLAQVERDHRPPSAEDFAHALRRARVRQVEREATVREDLGSEPPSS